MALLVERAEEIRPRRISVPTSRPTGRGRGGVAVLVGLPLVLYALPAVLGHPVVPSDDFMQNYPLRVLAGAQLRSGHLPLYDPYIWSGAPLLGGWNAGAAYPLTLLFAVFSGTVAWTINLMVTWWVAGLGAFAFLRASRLSNVASFLGGLSFAFTGAMAAQVPHFGLVAGMSWVPIALLALRRMSERRGVRRQLVWTATLAGSCALIVLAGEPRAIDDAVVVIALYAVWRLWRLGRRSDRVAYGGLVAAGVGLGAALSAVQWMPGMAAVQTSQRALPTMALFDSGSLATKWLLLSVVPTLFGGSGSFGEPTFFAHYSLAEVTGYVGIMPLVAAVALLGQLRWRQRLPEWFVWHVLAAVGVVLALGGNTALGPVLMHIPLFGGQRLQSRNIMIADLALAVLLAYWVDLWLAHPRPAPPRFPSPRRLLGVIPGAAVVAIVTVTLVWGAGMLRWLGLSPSLANGVGRLKPWLVPFLVLGAGAVALVVWGPRLDRRRRTRALVCFVVVDVAIFTLLTVTSVAPGLTGSPTPASTASRSAPPAVRTGADSTAAANAAAATAAASAPVLPLRGLVGRGRFAIYDPGLLDSGELSQVGVSDANVLTGTPSVEGYSAIVDNTYAQITGSHQALGEGQNVLDPAAISDGTLDQLDTTVLLTPSAYLVTSTTDTAASDAGASDAGASDAGAQTGRRNLAPEGSTTWYLGAPLDLTSLTIPVTHDPGGVGPGLHVGLVRPAGSTDWMVPVHHAGGVISVSLATPAEVAGVRVVAGTAALDLGPPVVRTVTGVSYRADGQLQDALVAPHWTLRGLDGAFAVFGDSRASPPLTVRAGPDGSSAGTAVRATSGPAFAPTSAAVSSPRAVTVVRAVADIPGWTAAWRPAGGGRSVSLPVRRAGLVQAVTVPAGRGVVSWRYVPPGFALGLGVSVGALVLMTAIGLGLFVWWRRSRRAWPGPRSGAPRLGTARCRPSTARHAPTPWRPVVVPSAPG